MYPWQNVQQNVLQNGVGLLVVASAPEGVIRAIVIIVILGVKTPDVRPRRVQ